MEITTTDLPQSRVKICVTLPPERFDRCYAIAIREASKKISLPGFRKGRAPEEMVEQHVGQQALLSDASDLAIQQSLPDALNDKNLEVLGQPSISITKMAKGNEFSYEAEFSVFPAVQLSDYHTITGSLDVVPVTDKDVDAQLEELRRRRATTAAVSRAAKQGDVLDVDFEVRIDKVKIEGGESKHHPVVLGEGQFIPGFEDQLLGASAGETKTFPLAFPKDYHADHLAGKDAEFTVKIHTVQERTLPVANDDFAKSLGAFDSLSALRAALRKNLEHDAEHKAHEQLRDSLMKQLQKGVSIEIPDILLESEQDRLVADLERRISATGGNFDDYLSSIQKTREDLRKDFLDVARRRIESYLLLREVSKREHITVSDDELGVEFSKLLAQYPNPDEVRKQLNERDVKAVMKDQIQQEKVFSFLENIATGAQK